MVKVNMMSNTRDFGDDWVHIDRNLGSQKIKYFDIWMKDQFPGSIDLLYCSHGIAYFTTGNAKMLIDKWFEKIKSGGILRIATPDWEVLRGMPVPMIGPIYGIMESANDIIQHKTIYTFDTLKQLLESCGFINIRRYDHRTTEHPNTSKREDKYDDHSAAYHNGVLISLNVECTKP